MLSATIPQETLFIKKLSANAIIPTRGSVDAAGYDLYAAVDGIVPSKGKAIINTDLSLALPVGIPSSHLNHPSRYLPLPGLTLGTYGRVAPRSGLAVKNFIDVGAGVIDRGNPFTTDPHP
jgi:dUTP pyrophosphatase